MRKAYDKTLQFVLMGAFPVFREKYGLPFPELWRSLIVSPLQELGYIARKRWAQRLPAVIAAGMLMNIFIGIIGLKQQDLLLASFVAIWGLGIFIFIDGLR